MARAGERRIGGGGGGGGRTCFSRRAIERESIILRRFDGIPGKEERGGRLEPDLRLSLPRSLSCSPTVEKIQRETERETREAGRQTDRERSAGCPAEPVA